MATVLRTLPALTMLLSVALMGGCEDGSQPTPAPEQTKLIDPLSIPASPTLDPSDFKTSSACATCHANHVREWRLSRHAFAMRDPVFQRLVALRNVAKANQEDGFCTQCHTTIGTRGGECEQGFNFDTLSPVVMEGVTCEACHKSTEVVRTFNAGHKLDAKSGMGATLVEPIATPFHGHRSTPHMANSDFCGSCHDVIETSGLPLERPHAEWKTSPAKAAGQTCQDCHMPSRTAPAAAGGPDREVHSHLFVGVETQVGGDVTMSASDRAEMNAAIQGLLSSAASLALSVSPSTASDSQLDLVLTVTNKIAGHNFPTGSSFLRQVWVAVTAKDATGKVFYISGDLDDNGDLRNHWSELDPYGDSDLISLSSRFIDAHGNRTLFTWEAVEHTSDAIEPLLKRTWTLFLPVPKDAQGPLTIEARLHFRAYGPFLLRLLGLSELIKGFPIWTIDTAKTTVQVTP